MTGGRSKYNGEQDPRYGGQMHYPGNLQGVPYRGDAAPILSPEAMQQLQTFGDFQVGLFDLMDPDHLANYIWVMDRVYNRRFKVIFLQRYWNPESGKVLIYVEWCQIYSHEAKSGGR